jgi:hypothetical protein
MLDIATRSTARCWMVANSRMAHDVSRFRGLESKGRHEIPGSKRGAPLFWIVSLFGCCMLYSDYSVPRVIASFKAW